MLILLHTSKTMHQLDASYAAQTQPDLISKSSELASYLQSLFKAKLAVSMSINPKLAANVQTLYENWTSNKRQGRKAIYSFAGDIYSGLQVQTWTDKDIAYANDHLRILSGLYGVLRPLDGIQPYRLELGYKLPKQQYNNLYTFWGDAPARSLPASKIIIDLAAKEYSKLVLPYLSDSTVIAPKFMTVSPKTGKPTFVVVHAKIARGAFAAWLIKQRISNIDDLPSFSELGYAYNNELSTPREPVFVCTTFGGLGLSVRLQHT